MGWPAPPQPDDERHDVPGRGERCRWATRVYFLAFSLSGPEPLLTARSTSTSRGMKRGLIRAGGLPTELSVVDVACLSSPRRGARRTRGRMDTPRPSRIGTLAVSPTNVSMPLAYPSTLDRRPVAQRPTWRGVGARCSPSVTVNWQAKVTRTVTRAIQRHIVEDLSLSSGASGTDRTFQAEHHLLVGRS